ncbi:MAG: TusE/DsrC/DsvC family sulfur relay protein [Deltaproteobacteria bacterium]|nr:TusE/DsrC/DsvC family sulfur relay protein [Deltaproteobacteria bacterium]
MTFEMNGTTYETDEDGYLLDLDVWTTDVANHLAKIEEVELSEKHWDVINFLRDYYKEYQIAPMVKILIKEMATKNEMQKKEASKYLYELFPNGPAIQACKIAGLPKPTGCV